MLVLYVRLFRLVVGRQQTVLLLSQEEHSLRKANLHVDVGHDVLDYGLEPTVAVLHLQLINLVILVRVFVANILVHLTEIVVYTLPPFIFLFRLSTIVNYTLCILLLVQIEAFDLLRLAHLLFSQTYCGIRLVDDLAKVVSVCLAVVACAQFAALPLHQQAVAKLIVTGAAGARLSSLFHLGLHQLLELVHTSFLLLLGLVSFQLLGFLRVGLLHVKNECALVDFLKQISLLFYDHLQLFGLDEHSALLRLDQQRAVRGRASQETEENEEDGAFDVSSCRRRGARYSDVRVRLQYAFEEAHGAVEYEHDDDELKQGPDGAVSG